MEGVCVMWCGKKGWMCLCGWCGAVWLACVGLWCGVCVRERECVCVCSMFEK